MYMIAYQTINIESKCKQKLGEATKQFGNDKVPKPNGSYSMCMNIVQLY